MITQRTLGDVGTNGRTRKICKPLVDLPQVLWEGAPGTHGQKEQGVL